jgi:hypothetical protein
MFLKNKTSLFGDSFLKMKQIKHILFILFCLTAVSSYANSPLPAGVIDLGGEWKFATENYIDEGVENYWYSDSYNDRLWIEIQTGKTWNELGIKQAGFGWYRKKIFIPLEYKNVPLVLFLGEILYDDDVYFNGHKIGGLHGPYKFKDLLNREYAVPNELIKYGAENLIAVRTWGMLGKGNEGANFGLYKGPFYACFEPLAVMLQRTDMEGGVKRNPRGFDISAGQHSLSFDIICTPEKSEKNKFLKAVSYSLFNYFEDELASGNASFSESENGNINVTVNVDKSTAHKIYFAGRFKLILKGIDSTAATLFETENNIDRLAYTSRDNLVLADTFKNVLHDTPYGKLRLIDEIDCSQDSKFDEHPYMQSGFDVRHQYQTPGSPVDVNVNEVLGKKVRESGKGWFAYRIGRGKLSAGKMYLVRIEYPEDNPRYCPVEIQTGENYMDIGWRTGISPDNPYDNWALSGKYEWYDAIVPLDKTTAGTSGANGASSENGFWIYFMNKRDYPAFYPLFEGGPAISKIRLYEIDAGKSAPIINKPEGLPERVFMCDWERQALIDPVGVVQYCKLMGYNAISPLILKWHFMNYADPLAGYNSYNVDEKGYWNQLDYAPEEGAKEAIPGKTSVHYNFLEATKKYAINYIPRIEYGGSLDLPLSARAVSADGKSAKPNRFAQWSSDLLQPAVFDEFKVLLDFLIGKNIGEYPQIKGALWRIRCDRMPISYSQYDVNLFSEETNILVPENLSAVQLAEWASTGDIGIQYADWWHKKRAEFHSRLGSLMKSYRPDLKMYYYNWDTDKFSLGMTDFTGWDFLTQATEMAKTNPESVLNLYLDNIKSRKKLTGTDYIHMIEKGDLGVRNNTLPHHGLRPYLYKEIEGFELFAPANSLCLADNEDYLHYFETKEGVAVSNAVPYDESFGRFINHKYEANETTPGGNSFSMALELMSYFHTDANTITFTTYTYGRGFAVAHRRFAQAYLALPAVKGDVVPYPDDEVKVRRYDTKNGIYVGVAYKGHQNKVIKVELEKVSAKNPKVVDLVTGKTVKVSKSGNKLQFEVNSGAMELNSFLIK